MIVLGDARQLQPIQAGAAFRAFVDVTGYAELDSVVRQSTPWMREAAIAFGSGDAEAGVAAYLDHDRLAWAETKDEARAGLIADWLPYHRSGADVTLMAHRNKDVIALNVDARDALKDIGALGPDHRFTSERGEKLFAVGDRVLFLQNERSLGVFNGSTGEVVAAARNRLDVLVDGETHPINVRANQYNHLDHGYARTIHKEQGNTVDRAFVYLSPTMDAQLAYVSLTRHRDDVTLYASREDFRSRGELVEQLTRDRLQDSTALYRSTADYTDVVRGFAERRGFPTTRTITRFVRANVQYLRERFDKLSAAFDRLRRPPQHLRIDPASVAGNVRPGGEDQSAAAMKREGAKPTPPEIGPLLNRALDRLSQDLASEPGRGQKAARFRRTAFYELNTAGTASALRAFNAEVRAMLPREALLSQGQTSPGASSAILETVPETWRSYLQENWDQVFAAQWAETQSTLQPLKGVDATTGLMPTPQATIQSQKAITNMPPEKPLIEAVSDVPPLEPAELRRRALEDAGARPQLSTAQDIAGRMYSDPDRAVAAMVAEYQRTGDGRAVASAVEREPEAFGTLRGATRLGIANTERRAALEQAPVMARQITAVTEIAIRIEARTSDAHKARREAMALALADLSPEAVHFLRQVDAVSKQPGGSQKDANMRNLLSDRASIQEVARFQQAVEARYGRGRSVIEKGIETDPGLAISSPAEQREVQSRVRRVLETIPAISDMRAQVRQRERAPELGQDKPQGIER